MKTIFCLTLLLSSHLLFAQKSDTLNFYKEIKDYPLSEILAGMNGYGSGIKGFIGTDFQRFQIHFNSIKQNPRAPYEYLVSGKTKVKDNINTFTGLLFIKSTVIYSSEEAGTGKYEGIIRLQVTLTEDKNQYGAGVISGTLTVGFVTDRKQYLASDEEVWGGADAYTGNQFEGKWTSNKTQKSKVLNWGDFRIPGIPGSATHIDQGDGEFMVNPKFMKNGWEDYPLVQEWYGSNKTPPPATKQALQRETAWWK